MGDVMGTGRVCSVEGCGKSTPWTDWTRCEEHNGMADETKPKIFVFCNGCAPQWHNFVAIAEDGTPLAGHLCSEHFYAPHDMGVIETGWKRDIYAKHYPHGFEVVYVEVTSKADFDAHPGLVAAAELASRRAAKEMERE